MEFNLDQWGVTERTHTHTPTHRAIIKKVKNRQTVVGLIQCLRNQKMVGVPSLLHLIICSSQSSCVHGLSLHICIFIAG